MTAPRVGINLLWLLPEVAGGAESYAIRLLHALASEAAGLVEPTLLCNRRFLAAHADLADRFPTSVAPIDGGSRPVRVAAESTWLRRAVAAARVHLVHHLNDVVPWVRNRRSALTIHDLRAIELPEALGRVQGAYLRARMRPSARAASVITTPSAFVRERVIEVLGADPDRVQVVSAPSPVDRDPRKPASPADPPTFVYPAITTWHKNHDTLLRAFVDVVAAHGDAVLVLTGAPGPAEEEVRRTIDALGLGDRVRRPGRIPAGDLDDWLRSAVGLVFPSRYEGFGLPLVEAMAVGCPVVASNRTALPEVVGDAGILVDPDDVGGWSEAMLRLIEDDRLRASLIAAGRDRVRWFTPAETARRQVEAYRIALDAR